MKPILFNTEMVRAILAGRKTVTRRVVKPPALYAIVADDKGQCVGSWYEDQKGVYFYPTIDDCCYRPGDILYVRETWAEMPYGYVYRADEEKPEGWDADDRWHPSIHMPKEAARLFLRVTKVRAERLQDMKEEDAVLEGFRVGLGGAPFFSCLDALKELWDNTIKKADLPRYGWNANPWVFAISFERIGRDEALQQMS